MAIGKRIFLFILTNILVLVLVGIVFRLVGFTGYYTCLLYTSPSPRDS